MLQKIRDGLQGQKWLAYTLLGVLALVFAAWGAYGIVELNFGGANYAAEVEGERVPLAEAREAWMQQQAQWQERLGGQELPEALKRSLQDELLESFVRTTLLSQRAREFGYRVTDAQVKEAIQNEPAFQIDGKYSPDVAKARLAQAGISAQAYENDLRRGLQRAQLQTAISVSNFVTPHELARLRALEDEEREIRFATLPAEKFAGDAPISDEDIEKFYSENEQRYMNPEYVRLAYGELRLEQLAAQATVEDEEVRQAYEAAKESYVIPEKRRARHILIEGGEGEKDGAARKEAEQLLAEAKAGKDFAALAKEHSDDPGSASQGGDLGWAERSYFVAPFADALFSMKPGEIRGPVKTDFGYHIIKLEEIQPGKTRSFEEARAEIEAELQRERAAERLTEVQDELERRLEAPDADLEALAKEFGMQTGQVERFERGAGGAPLGNSPELQEVVFANETLDQRRPAGPIPLGEDRLLVVKVLDHQPPAPKPIAEVRESIVEAIRRERGTFAALKAAQEAKAKLEGGASFDEVVKSLGVTAEPAKFVGRNDPSVPAQIRTASFDSPKPKEKPVYAALGLESGGAALVAITAVRSEPAATSSELQASRAQQAIARTAMADFTAYLEEARRKADVEKNPSAFE